MLLLSPATRPADTTTLNGRWFLQAVLPSDTAAGKIPNITFTVKDYRFTGNTGCNKMEGTFKLTGKSLKFDAYIKRGKKICTGYNEEAFIKSLLQANNYKFEKGVLILMFDATELSRWTRAPTPPVKTERA